LIRGSAAYFLGHGERFSGHAVDAERTYIEASELALRTDNLLIALFALANLTNVQISLGRLSKAAKTSSRILEITTEQQRLTWPVAGLAYQGLGKLYYEWNELDTAAHYLHLGIEYGRRGGLISLEFVIRSILTQTLQAQGDVEGADEMMKKVGLMEDQTLNPLYTARIPAIEASLRWAQGYQNQAIHWAETCGLSLNVVDFPYALEQDYLLLARIRRTQGKLQGIGEMLAQLLQNAESDKRVGNLIEILIQQALLQHALGMRAKTIQLIERALKLAEPEGYVRSFLDEGKPMRLLLLEYQASIKEKIQEGVGSELLRIIAYIDKLLAAFSQAKTIEKTNSNNESLLDLLSERELEVLRLIAGGHSNQEIADKLVVTVSTVKTHINRLYSKLGTQRRTQAIIIARAQGLLSD